MRVPALALDSGDILIQSLAIIEYLDETHPAPPLLPHDPLARAKVRALSQLIACDIHPLNNVAPLRYLKNKLGHTQADIDAWYHHWIVTGFEALESMIAAGPYAFGPEITLADICIVPQVYNARRLKTPLDRFPKIGRVLFWMTGALLSFVAMAVSIRSLSGALNVFEILSIRNGFGLVITIIIALIRPEQRRTLLPTRLGLQFLRNAMHFAAQYAWALSITLLPFATIFALEFSMPAWATLLAYLTLGERMTVSRIGAIALGFVGVMIILRPGLAAFHPAAILVLAAAFGFAAGNIVTKKLVFTESTFSIIFWMNVIQLPMGLAGSDLQSFLRLDASYLLPVLGIGIAGLSSHYCLTNALRWGDASIVAPFDFLRLPLIALIGWWVYGESLDAFVFFGAVVIFSGIVWNVRAEAARK
jgi:drug/metabolite transporter (DMT)-like permease